MESVGPQEGEWWHDRDGRVWGPLQINPGTEYSKDDYYFIVSDPDGACSRAWTRQGAYYSAGAKSTYDLMRRQEVTLPVPGAPTDDLSVTLATRKNTHGEYNDHARITQDLKAIIRSGPSYEKCSPHERETLDMIAHKIGRVVSGDPHFTDHWHDIAGYARLSEERNK